MPKNWSQEKYIEAIRYASERHKDQLFPGTDWPYLLHLSMVAMEVMAAVQHEPDVDGDLALTAALLHDVLEDTNTEYAEIRSKFGRGVADGVKALTKEQKLEKRAGMAGSLKRIKQQPKEIWMVKLADRITNLQPPPGHWVDRKKERYLNEAVLILNELKGGSQYLAGRLGSKIEAYKSYIRI